jgi:hypothetical protein
MTGPEDKARPELEGVQIEVYDPLVIDEMVGKIRAATVVPGAAEAVDEWRERHGHERWADIGHDHAVVGETLMYLHDAPDGVLIPHARYPDGTEKIYTDPQHVDALF